VPNLYLCEIKESKIKNITKIKNFHKHFGFAGCNTHFLRFLRGRKKDGKESKLTWRGWTLTINDMD